jgi:copper oxidase (laccase) domain-containing protein
MMDACKYPEGEFRWERLSRDRQVGRFAALEAVGVAHLVAARPGPDVPQVHHDPALPLREVAQVLGLESVAFSEPVHAADVLLCKKSGCAGSADGLVTTTEGLALIGQSDDGPIVLIADSHRRAVGLAQASWRATVAGIVPAVVRRMVDLGCDPRHLVACICPSAGPCCFEVGEEVRTLALQRIGPHAMPFFRLAERRRQAPAPPVATCEVPRLRFDLWRANACALARAGLGAQSIHVAAICPVCRHDLFPRGRRRGDSAGRLAAGIGWASSASAGHTKEKASERSKPRKGRMLRDS